MRDTNKNCEKMVGCQHCMILSQFRMSHLLTINHIK